MFALLILVQLYRVRLVLASRIVPHSVLHTLGVTQLLELIKLTYVFSVVLSLVPWVVESFLPPRRSIWTWVLSVVVVLYSVG